MTEPLTHARIGYDSIGKRGTVSASAELTGFPASAAANELTYSFWSAGLPATWEVLLAEAEVCNYFGIAAHTLLSNNAMAVMQAWIDDAWLTLPVLTTTGDLWRFDGDFFGARGGAPGTTFGSLRRGIAVDGMPIKVYGFDEQESKFGTHSVSVEPGLTNLFPENVRNGGDTSQDLTGFDGTSDGTYSTDRAVSGAGSILVTSGGGVALLRTDPVAVISSSPYTMQCKLSLPTAQTATLKLVGDVSGQIGGLESFVDIQPGNWNVLSITRTAGGADTTIYAVVTIGDGSCHVDELQIDLNSLPFTWADGAGGGGDLAYPPEILQQVAGDLTINLWGRMPNSAIGLIFMDARTSGGSQNAIRVWNPVNANKIGVSTSDAAAAVDDLEHVFTWGDAWHMITVVLRPGVSGEDNKLLYVDGKLATSTETTRLPTWSAITAFDVGHAAGLNRLGSSGTSLLDDLTILNRAATAAEIKAWYDSGETMDLATAGLPSHADDRPIMTLVEATTSRNFRVRIVGQTTPVLGVIYIGEALEMERPFYGGHAPVNLSRITVTRPNVSERGQFLGRSIVRSGASGAWAWNNLTAAWVRRYLDPFLESARALPFFVLWRPVTFPGESAYCWTLQDPPPPVNSGSKDRMSFTLDAEGLGNE